ncbi:MAG: ABC transporter permease [Desulfurococcales archaeon]|nr:ABC transporter permease [Desulfurococcales archaeon]
MQARKLKAVAKKELRELVKERLVLFGLLLGPLIMYVIMGGAAAAASSSMAKQAIAPPRVAIVYEAGEPDNITLVLARILHAPVFNESMDPLRLLDTGYEFVIVINKSLSATIASGKQAPITVYYKPKSLGWFSLNRPKVIESLVDKALLNATAIILKKYMPDITPEYLQNPARIQLYYYHNGRTMSQGQVVGLIMGVSLAIPLAILTTAVAATQVAAISMGVEKEAKTLEKLLTLPLSREELLLGKLFAVTVLALGGVASYMAGLYTYFAMLSHSYSSIGAGQVSFQFTVPVGALIVTGVGLALTLYASIVIGFIVGSQAHDVRGSQLASSYTAMVLAIPLFIMFFGVDPTQLSATAKALLAIDPYSLLGLASSASINGDTGLSMLSLLGLLVHDAFWTLVAARLLDAESMIVGHPLLRRLSRVLAKRRTS